MFDATMQVKFGYTIISIDCDYGKLNDANFRQFIGAVGLPIHSDWRIDMAGLKPSCLSNAMHMHWTEYKIT